MPSSQQVQATPLVPLPQSPHQPQIYMQSFGHEIIPNLLSNQHIRADANTPDQNVDEAKPSSLHMIDMGAPILGLSQNLTSECPGQPSSPLFVPTNQPYMLPEFSGYTSQYDNAPFSDTK